MIKMKRFFAFFVVIFLINGYSNAQDPHFSQFYANPLYLNPAFAGTTLCPRVILNFRDQWPSIAGTYVTYNASYDQHIDKLSGGLGFIVNTDRQGQGILNTTTASLLYSFRLEVNRSFSMKMALQSTYFQKNLDWGKLTFGDQIDPKHGFVYPTSEPTPSQSDLVKRNADFSAGLLGYGEKYFVGFAVHHITEPDEGFVSESRMPRKFTVHAGGVINLGKKTRRNDHTATLSPNILFMQQANFQELNYGLYFNKYPFVGGMWFRQSFNNADALVFLVGVQASMFKIGYSYDVTLSKLTNATGGAHEISFALQFNCKPPRKRVRAINCPVF